MSLRGSSVFQDIISTYLQPLSPEPTGTKAANLESSPKIKACIFDIYGTLLISGSGEVGTVSPEQKETFFIKALEDEGVPLNLKGGISFAQLYHKYINDHHRNKLQAGIPHAEVEIRTIWDFILQHMLQQNVISIFPENDILERIAFRYELMTNPVFPMPGAERILHLLSLTDCRLGIVSNAQFYTPVLLEFFFGPLDKLGFEDRYCIWSYKAGRSKPDPWLFKNLLTRLQKEDGIVPGQCLYIGNDMLNDVWTASQTGMLTALFVGDSRSLRWREADERCKKLEPDFIITELMELQKLFTGWSK